MLSMLRLLLAFALLLCAGLVHADDDGCDGRAASIVAQAYPSAKASGKGSYRIDKQTLGIAGENAPDHPLTCKVWPEHPNWLLVYAPWIGATSEDGSEGDLDLLVLDRASLRVRQRLHLPGLMNQDAVGIGDLSLDTAHYRLTPENVAFGLRITREGSSRANPFEEVDLSLYVIDGDALRPVIEGVVVSQSQGEWDTRCAGDFTDISRTLTIAPTHHQGYADIQLAEKTATRKMTQGKDGQCNDQPAPVGRKSYTLVYDGKHYALPKDLRPLE